MKLKRRFKKRYIVYFLLFSYLVFCQSCMTMRMNKKKTKSFFESHKGSYIDSTIVIENYSIHFIETGIQKKPTLIFVHGSPGSWDAYKDYLKDSLLLQKYRMIGIDRPGFGYSNFGEAQNLKTQAIIISSFVDKMQNGNDLVLVGHSMGGPVMVKMATLYPEKYENLVILSGAIDPKAEKPEKWRKFFMAKPFRYIVPGALRPANDELWWLKQDLIDMKPTLKEITSKVLIIHGTNDELVPYSNVDFMLNNTI